MYKVICKDYDIFRNIGKAFYIYTMWGWDSRMFDLKIFCFKI